MQHNDGLELRRTRGDQPCDHRNIVPELFDNTPTGDFLCSDCGKVFQAWEIQKLKDRSDED